MSSPLSDQRARDRFREEWDQNFAVSANAGSGKTTAISERLAAMAQTPRGAGMLRQTAVVTFTKKAAAQIGRRAREVLVRELTAAGGNDLSPLDSLERAFFGTIHSFCLLLAQRYGQTLGINLNPAVVAENDDDLWEEFLEEDSMQFEALSSAQVEAFLRHAPLESTFGLARRLDTAKARNFLANGIKAGPMGPSPVALQEILAASTRPGKAAEALRRNQETVQRWQQRFLAETSYLPFPKPEGAAGSIKELYAAFFAPVKGWMADAGAVLAAELALRYRAWRFDRGVQTYADQVEAALSVLHDETTLERIRAEGWRVLLDEAQDTDPQQFAVLVEITRPPLAPLGTWPRDRTQAPGQGPSPRAGHFCMVGDGQQAIYGTRADVRNFQRYLDAFGRGDGGELLIFDVTFRSPHRVVELLNTTLPAAFAATREHNIGVPAAGGVAPPLLQVHYEPLVPGPRNAIGAAGSLGLVPAGTGRIKVAARLAAEVRQIAVYLTQHGPAGVGARKWGDICLLAPRNDWLITARKELEAAGLKAALQMRKNRNGDSPVYAWMCGLLAVLCDPDNSFEWAGVLRDVFGVSDAAIAVTLQVTGRFCWEEPERHPEPVRTVLALLKPLIERVDAEAEPLDRFAGDLSLAARLADKARLVDASGDLEGELDGMLAHAADLGLKGAGPREWLAELLMARESGRPAGKTSDDAINLLTSHSAKGLEWPVVIPMGLWRSIGKAPEEGLRLVTETGGQHKVYFDNESLPALTREARERERLRELVRLLYVTLTRSRVALVLPWGPRFAEAEKDSFASLWGAHLDSVPALTTHPIEPMAPGEVMPSVPLIAMHTAAPIKSPAFPARLLPHQLAREPDAVRSVRHESGPSEASPVLKFDPINYGLWWHETMEFLPWQASEPLIEAHCRRALMDAGRQGFRLRAEEEIRLLRKSTLYAMLSSSTWKIFSELSVMAPANDEGWIDGIIDLVAQNSIANELLVLDWKTNRIVGGESTESFLLRLTREYQPQLAAYGACIKRFFPHMEVKLGIYGSAVGTWSSL